MVRLEDAGYRVVLGSPYTLATIRRDGPRRCLRARAVGARRHYKTDWWTERESVWTDEALPDTAPSIEPLRHALTAEVEERTAIVNPFGSVVPQNKRAMALFWGQYVHRFSTWGQGVIERLIDTSRLENVHAAQLLAQSASSEGLRATTAPKGTRLYHRAAVHGESSGASAGVSRGRGGDRQRFFEATANADGRVVNYGGVRRRRSFKVCN